MLFQQRLFQLLRQAPEPTPVIRHGTAAMGNQKTQRGEVLEQVAGQALHEGGGVGIQIMRTGGVKAGIATGADVNHGGNVVLHHLLVNGVPVFVTQRGRCPVATTWIRVQVDADVAIFFDAFFQLGDAGFGVYAGRLRQHGGADEVVREKLGHAVAQLVANRRPGAGHIEVTNVVRHKAGTRTKDGEV